MITVYDFLTDPCLELRPTLQNQHRESTGNRYNWIDKLAPAPSQGGGGKPPQIISYDDRLFRMIIVRFGAGPRNVIYDLEPQERHT